MFIGFSTNISVLNLKFCISTALVFIMLKPLNKATNRLQRILFKLQKYNLNVKYKQRKYMFVADALSRGHLPIANTCEFIHSLEVIDLIISLPLSTEQLLQVKQASRDDTVLQQLHETSNRGWPLSKSDVAEYLHAYFDYQDELIVQTNHKSIKSKQTCI